MTKQTDSQGQVRNHHEQMLRLVAKSFYSELVNYGVDTADVLTVAEHLLNNVQDKGSPKKEEAEHYSRLFKLRDVQDDWAEAKRLSMKEVSISPMNMDVVPQVVTWLKAPAIRDTFYPGFPDSIEGLRRYFQASGCEYFSIYYREDLAGIIGAENLDLESAKLEMRKLVGDARMHGKGIGKRATFLFLYYAFVIRKFRKVYLHSMDVNIRNINLNSRFGFELEGVFLADALVQNKWRDVVRMALHGPTWLELFS